MEVQQRILRLKMPEKTDKNKALREYLLGGIACEAEREKLEARLMSDEDFYQQLELEETELAQEYADGELDPAESETFEKYLSRSGRMRKRVEFAKSLRKYVNEQAASIHAGGSSDFELQTAEPAPVIKEDGAQPGLFSNWFLRPLPIVFAGVVLLVAAFAVWKLPFTGSETELALSSLNKAYKTERPLQARISDIDYAPLGALRGGLGDSINLTERNRAERILLDDAAENPNAETLHALGRLYLLKKDFDQALAQLEKSQKLSPENAGALNDLGTAYLEKSKSLPDDAAGRIETAAKALEFFEEAIKFDPASRAARFNKALNLEALNLPGQAAVAWKEYLRLDSDSPWAEEARNNLKRIESQNQESRTAEEVTEEYTKAFLIRDADRAYKIISRNREMITGKLVPQQLAFLFVEAHLQNRPVEAAQRLEALKYAGALEETRSGDAFWREVGDYYEGASEAELSLLGKAHFAVKNGYNFCLKSKYAEALAEFQQAQKLLARANNSLEAKLLDYWIGYCRFQLDEVRESTGILNGLADFSAARNYKWLRAQALSKAVDAYYGSRDYARIVELNKQSLALAEEISDDYLTEKVLLQLADVYYQLNDSNNALYYFERAFAFDDASQKSLRQLWRKSFFSAEVFYSRGLYAAAAAFEADAIEVAQSLQDPTLIHISDLTLGIINKARGRFEEAWFYIEESRRTAGAQSDEPTRKRLLNYTEVQIGHFKRETGDCAQAISFYDGVIESLSSMEFRLEEYEARKGRLLCYAESQNNEAVATELPIVLRIFERNRETIIEEQTRNHFFDREQSVYDLAVDYEYEKGNYEQAYDYTEQSLSRSLLDLLNSRAAPETVKTSAASSANVVSQPRRVNDFRRDIPETVQILQYSVLPGKVLVWLVSNDDLAIGQTVIPIADLQKKVLDYSALISNKDAAAGDAESMLAEELYNILISPVADRLSPYKKLAIVPDKFLFRLSFSALIAPGSKKRLISDYSVFFAPSANTYLLSSNNLRKSLEKNLPESLLAVGNPSFDKTVYSNLPDLPDARREAEEIGKLYRSPVILAGKQATKESFKKHLRQASVMHFAGHYVVDEHSPMRSGFILNSVPETGRSGNGENRGVLFNRELAGEKLKKTKLVILSACRTGVEDYYAGEGMIGAARAFLAAGVPQVVASFWEVESGATADLMILFHRYRKTGNLSATESLRRAQIEIMNASDGKYRHPYYWAAFMTLGGEI
jgi:CHAT domain-containing protein/Flp pilus assembly protein TadD